MPVWVLVRVFASRANMPHSCSSLLAVVLLRFQRIAEDIASGLDAFCVCVGVHFERDAFIGMTEFFGNRSNIRVVRDSDAGECVPLRYNYDKPEKPRISRVFGYLARFFILFQTEKSSREVVIS